MRQRRLQAALRFASIVALGLTAIAALGPSVQADMVIRAGDSGAQSLAMPSFQPGIVPPLGSNIVPPLVPGPCCQGGMSHGKLLLIPVILSQRQAAANPLANLDSQSAKSAAIAKTTAPAPDIQPRLVSLKPYSAMPGDPVSVLILRPGYPDEVVTFAAATTPAP